MRELHELSPFRRDLKRIKKSGRYSIADIDDVIKKLRLDLPLPERMQDHDLSGAWGAIDARDCHIKPDLLLICRKNGWSASFVPARQSFRHIWPLTLTPVMNATNKPPLVDGGFGLDEVAEIFGADRLK